MAKAKVEAPKVEEVEPEVVEVDPAQAYHDEANANGFIAVQHMDGDHPDDPTQHVQVVKDATAAGVYDYRV